MVVGSGDRYAAHHDGVTSRTRIVVRARIVPRIMPPFFTAPSGQVFRSLKAHGKGWTTSRHFFRRGGRQTVHCGAYAAAVSSRNPYG
jgi:hypothetical protein